MSGPLFVECRNYFEIPNSCQGMLCAYVTPEMLSLWRLGFIDMIYPETQEMELSQWIGKMTMGSAESGNENGNQLYPLFYFKSFKDWNNGVPHPMWQSHFVQISVKMCGFNNF